MKNEDNASGMTMNEGESVSVYSKNRELESKLGNVTLCTSLDAREDKIWRVEDRFDHLLALGPVGSGKTSQILLPLINQDMQNAEAGITVIEPIGDLAGKVHAMAEHYGRESVYFNPTLPDCPYFNPLFGKEEDVVENLATTFKMLNPDSPQFFLNMNETLIRNAITVLKRLYGNKTNFNKLYQLIHNSAGIGRHMVEEFSKLLVDNPDVQKENTDISAWFMNDYFNEKSKIYEHCSSLRSQVSKITFNEHLSKVLNPPNGENDVDFDKHLEEGGVITISTAQGDLRDLGGFLESFVILQFQSSVFKRPGNEDTRRAHFLYIDEFQRYANPGFADMLTQGRSYRVASHLGIQNRKLMGMNLIGMKKEFGIDNNDFVDLVSRNARNVIIFPGTNATDVNYYLKQTSQLLKKDEERKQFRELTEQVVIYQPFGQISYRLFKDSKAQEILFGKTKYISKELNNKLNKFSEG